ncbi:hypothetical protein HPB47_015498, partial [Ixodes persulcatus]
PVYACCVLFHVEVDFSVEASIPQGIWALHLNDSMRSRFGWIPHNPVWRRPKPWAVRANKDATRKASPKDEAVSRDCRAAFHSGLLDCCRVFLSKHVASVEVTSKD